MADSAGRSASTALTRKLARLTALSDEERDAIARVPVRQRNFPAERTLMGWGSLVPEVLLVEAGWAFNYWLLADGRRQIFDFLLPGDAIGLRTALFGFRDRMTATLTLVSATGVAWPDLIALFEEQPRLGAVLVWEAARQESRLQRYLLDIGQRDARERVAHRLVDLYERLAATGNVRGGAFTLPVTQEMLGDALGLSFVHVNRTLRWLRRQGLVVVSGRRYELPDIAALKRIAGYDETAAPRAQAFDGEGIQTLFASLFRGQSSGMPERGER